MSGRFVTRRSASSASAPGSYRSSVAARAATVALSAICRSVPMLTWLSAPTPIVLKGSDLARTSTSPAEV